MTKRRIVVVLMMAVAAIAVVSATLGRQIYLGQSPGLTSYAVIHFAGYLFFLLMPVEALVPIYQSEGHAGATLVLIAVGTAIMAQANDYGIGRFVSTRVIHDMIGQVRYERFETRLISGEVSRSCFLTFSLYRHRICYSLLGWFGSAPAVPFSSVSWG